MVGHLESNPAATTESPVECLPGGAPLRSQRSHHPEEFHPFYSHPTRQPVCTILVNLTNVLAKRTVAQHSDRNPNHSLSLENMLVCDVNFIGTLCTRAMPL
jgi:hypothetical protein